MQSFVSPQRTILSANSLTKIYERSNQLHHHSVHNWGKLVLDNFCQQIYSWCDKVRSWSWPSFLNSCIDNLLFMVWTGAAIDPMTEREQFPEYIQILAKDGVDLSTSTLKVVHEVK